MIRIDIEQGDDLAARDGRKTVVEIETRRDSYRVTASKSGRPNERHRVIDVPRGGGKRLYALLAEAFGRLS